MKSNILYFYLELQPSTIVMIHSLALAGEFNIYVVYYDKNTQTPYIPPAIDNVHYYKRSAFKDVHSLYNFALQLSPKIIYTAGWIDKQYMFACKKIRKILHIPVVSGSDTFWKGGKQYLNVLISPFLHKKCFSHIWAAGIWQYEYARKLGFSNNEIIMHNLICDIELFSKVSIDKKTENYPKKILFIGRFAKVKGLQYLLNAWNSIKNKNEWTLTLIGNGPQKEELSAASQNSNRDIEIIDFLGQEDIIKCMQSSGFFILPSLEEPWGVVLHEAACAGLPIASSNICGAGPYFVLDNYNGMTFTPGNTGEIKETLEKIINMKQEQLLNYSFNSRKLSQRITPEICVHTFLSLIGKSF